MMIRAAGTPTDGDQTTQSATRRRRRASSLLACVAVGALLAAGIDAPAWAATSETDTAATYLGYTYRADLRVDANRDGRVDLTRRGWSDAGGKQRASTERGALVLPNIDDDSGRCPKVPVAEFPADDGNSDERNERTRPGALKLQRDLPANPATDTRTVLQCNDAADDVVNGAEDEKDLSAMHLMPIANVEQGAKGRLIIEGGNGLVNVFLKGDAGWTLVTEQTVFTADQLRRGMHFGVEAKDIIRPTWNGKFTVEMRVDNGGYASTSAVAFQTAPVVFAHHGQRAQELWWTTAANRPQVPAMADLGKALQAAGTSAGVQVSQLDSHIGFLQDVGEPGYVSLPAADGPHGIRVNVMPRIPDDTAGIEGLFNQWRGNGLAVTAIWDVDPTAPGGLGAGGNTEFIPPYTDAHGKRWPHGRLLMGREERGSDHHEPARQITQTYAAQGVQGNPFFVDVSWLAVGHIDEVVSFVPADTARGWKLVVADPLAALRMAETAHAAGVTEFAPAPRGVPTVQDYLSPFSRKHIEFTAERVEAIVQALKVETQLTDAEIVRVPVAYGPAGASVEDAWENDRMPWKPGFIKSIGALPNSVNAQPVSGSHVIAADPFGPQVKGAAIFRQAVERGWATAGLQTLFVDDREAAWSGGGDVHCASALWREPTKWWTLR